MSKNILVGVLGLQVVAAGAILLMGGCSTCAAISGDHKREAEKQARKYAKELNMNVHALTCASSDSDGDGYVSCTLIEKVGPNKQGEITKMTHNIECAGAYNLNQSCRLPKFRINNGTQNVN